MVTPITVEDFKTRFDRDFLFGTTIDTVRDQDIEVAFSQGTMNFNEGLFDSDEIEEAFSLISAHCLVKLVTAGGGLKSSAGGGIKSSGSGAVASKSAGPLSVSYSLPGSLVNDPILSDLMTTGYGKMYLQILIPRLIGNVVSIKGATLP